MKHFLLSLFLLTSCNAASAANTSTASNTRNYSQFLYSATSAPDAGLNTGVIYAGPNPCIQIVAYADGGFNASDVTINDILVDGTVKPAYEIGALGSTQNGTITWWGPGHLDVETTGALVAGYLNQAIPPEFSVTTVAKPGIAVRLDISSCN
jgi:hypothetical protein